MAHSVSAVGLFCEDIREEKSGQDTIIGIFADNFAVPKVPGMAPKLGIYMRLHFDPNTTANVIATRLQIPGAPDMALGAPDNKIVQQSVDEAHKRNLPIAGVVIRAVVGPFQIYDYGQIKAIVTIDGVDHICAVLNVIPTIAIASAPPSAQSPTVP